jgi:2-C-methyl-D-erythritol 4-phosphate cytidylyltransferase
MKVSALITAGGYGRRMGVPAGKQFMEIAGKPLLLWTLAVFEQVKGLAEVVVVVNKEDFGRFKGLGVRLAQAGERRQDSVYQGLQQISKEAEIVVIHDGARPLVSVDLIQASIAAARDEGAGVVAVPVKNTIKKVSPQNFVIGTEDRGLLWAAQTPQTFRVKLIKEAYEKARAEKIEATDDAALVERLGYAVKIVPGSYENIKVTTPEDVMLAELLLKRKR